MLTDDEKKAISTFVKKSIKVIGEFDKCEKELRIFIEDCKEASEWYNKVKDANMDIRVTARTFMKEKRVTAYMNEFEEFVENTTDTFKKYIDKFIEEAKDVKREM